MEHGGAADPAGWSPSGLDAHARFLVHLLDQVEEAVLATGADGTITFWNAAAERLYGWTSDEVLGANAIDLILSSDSDVDVPEVIVVLARGETYSTEVVVRRRDGSSFPAHVTGSPLLDAAGGLVGVVGVSVDLSDRVRAESIAHMRATQTAAVAAVGELAVTQDSMSALLDAALDQAVAALDADIGSIFLGEGDLLRLHAAVGLPPELVGTHVIPTGDASLAGFTLATDDPVVVDDLEEDGRFQPPPVLLDAGAVSGVTAVLRSGGRGAGVMSVYTRRPRHFDREDVNVLRSIANVVAHAMERDLVHRQLARIAVTDELTGLPNRVLFLDRLEHALVQRSQGKVAVVFADLDRFKEVNDALGHAAGDQLLRAAAGRLTAHVRPGDTVARFGGDEFAILSESIADAAAAMELAERLTAAVAAEPVQLDGRELHVTVSMGVVVSEECSDAAELLRDADAAMYRAKAAGRGRVELFDEHLRATAVERLDLTNELAAGLNRDQLVVHYQPEVELGGAGQVWAEALVRWRHPTRGLLLPADFIDLAEDTGLIVSIGRQVLVTAAEQLARWRQEPAVPAPSAVSVNISARQLVDGDLVPLTAHLLDRLELDPRTLWFELTETALLREPERAIRTLHELKELGVGLAIDDFGTGYSSLAYARSLPVDALKIDQSFISGMGSNLRDESIVRAIVGLARSFDILAVAEGVETVEQLDELRRLGCHFAQGYLLSRPVDAEHLQAWMAARPPS